MDDDVPNLPPEDSVHWDSLSWWLVLIVAVLAIPSLAFVVVTITGIQGMMGIVVFMVACWACTYFGMHLMRHPSMSEKRDYTKRD